MNDFEFSSLEIAKILSHFNTRNVKLVFENPSDVNLVFNEIFPLFVQANGRFYKNKNYNSKGYELSCDRMKMTAMGYGYQYANLQLIADKDHNQNVQTVHDLFPYFSYYRKLPVVDINGIFGVDLSVDEKYLHGYYYSVVPYFLNELPDEQKSESLNDMKLSHSWRDYILSYANQGQPVYASYVGFDSKKILCKLGFSVLIKDFITKNLTKYHKFENLINFLQNESQFYNEEYEECGLQLPSIASSVYEDEYLGVELVPFPYENGRSRDEYLQFLDQYFTKMIEYKLITEAQKNFILNDDTTLRNKDGILKFRWKNSQTYGVKWYNIERGA